MTKRAKVLLGGAAAVLLLVGFGGWWFLIRDDAPAAVSLDVARESVDGTDTSGSAPAAGVGEAAGTWAVDLSIGSFDDFSGSFAGYRVEEELSTIGSNTAVGRTPAVSGDLTIDGAEVTDATVSADLTGLESDEAFRDRAAQSAIGTAEFPEAVFTTTEAIDLGGEPADGTAVTTDAAGELTLHGQTLPVTAALEAELVDGVLVVTGSIQIDMTDYGIDPPRLGPVVNISDQGEIEFQLFFTKP